VPATVTSTEVTAGALSQLSVAVEVPVFAGLESSSHSIVTSAAQVRTGAVESSTVMICRHVLLLPHESVAVQVRWMVSSCGHTVLGIIASEKEMLVTAASQLSVAVELPVLAGLVSSVHSMVTSAAQVSTGAVVSSMRMVWMQSAWLPHSS